MEYDFFDLGEEMFSETADSITLEGDELVTEERLLQSYKFHEMIDESHAKARDEAFRYVVI